MPCAIKFGAQRWKRWTLKAASLSLSAQIVSVLAATNSFPRYSVRIWQMEDGLPQNSVYAITQTKDGYLWVGTQQGLARFDGIRFVPMDEKLAADLRHGWITALCAARDGSLWVGCDGSGVTRLKDMVVSHFSESDGLPGSHPSCLLEARDGALWIGSEAGLTRFKEGKFVHYAEQNGLANNSVRGICEDSNGVIRVATSRGLSAVTRDGAISTLNFGVGTVSNVLKSVCQDRQGRIWVASNEGITCAEAQRRVFYGLNQGLPNRIGTVVFEDREGRVWAGTYNGLAGLADGKAVSKPMNDAGFGDLVYTIFQDREDNLWVGAQDGLYRLEPARFRSYTTQDGLKNNNVMSVFEEDDGTLWIGTWGGGINQLKGETILQFGKNNGLPHDKGLALHKGRDGSMWIGMDHGGGVNRLKKGENLVTRLGGLIDAAPRAILEDRQGQLWIGTSKGLNVVKEGSVQTYTTAEGLPGNVVLAICEARDGIIWLGTDSGLMRWQDGKFTTFTIRDGLAHNTVNALYEDPEHTLWIGTRGGGLNRLKATKFTTYNAKQGLFSDEIYEILEDDYGCFWMSCRNGIFRVRKTDFDDLDSGKTKTMTCVAFGKSDGLASVQCNGVAKPAGWKGKNGVLWFPTIRGVVAVDSAIRSNEKLPAIVVEDVIVDRRKIEAERWKIHDGGNAEQPLRLPPGHGELEIHYTALSFQAPEKNRFKYQLEGLDTDWKDAGTRHEAFYNNLEPGNYRFRVQGCNNDGIWNESGATFALILLPHFWQTWWFKAVVPAIFALMFWSWYHSRVSRIREIEGLRVQIAADLHDDVGSRLTKVAMVTELVDRQTSEGDRNKVQIHNIASTTREVIQSMDEIVWTINPKNDTLDNLANYIFQYAQEYFQNTGVRCRLDLPARLPDMPLSTGERHNLFMAFKEALNNVLKHAGATEVRIELAIQDETLVISIADNGCGFVPNGSNGSGNGLTNMKKRLHHIHGVLTLESKPGAGTKVEMLAPLK